MSPVFHFEFLRRRLRAFSASVLFLSLLLAGCSRVSKPPEVAYVNIPQANLRDRVAALYNKVGTVHNGEKVEVMDHARRFAKVKNTRGEQGWIEERFLIGPQVFNQFAAMSQANAKTPVQARAVTRASVNMHLSPGRDTDHLYQLKEGEKVDILKRATAEKPKSQAPAMRPLIRPKTAKLEKKDEEAPAAPMEDWSLVRDGQGRVGWVLARMLDIDVPLDIAQYAEGQRIAGYAVLNQVQDGSNKVNQYLVLFTESKDGMPFDYNQARIFTWNTKRHRYETAYRERGLFGVFPVTNGVEDFGKEGPLPTFTLRVKDEAGSLVERKYKLNGPIVRRVLSAQEEAQKAAAPRPRRRR